MTSRLPSIPGMLDASVCPLCGQANQCAIAAGQPAESCWCMEPGSIAPGALAALTPEQRGKTCICPACGSRGGPPPLPLAPI
ncbi:MAG: cysteine-rich CWC family protein [Burkholderiaceae bacterium]|nr:cysteine-rich CWC family protein [Burkholderiaceae bacterium]